MRSLADDGIDIVAASRRPPSEPAARTEFRAVDLVDPKSVAGLASGCDTVIHLAGLAHMIGHQLSDADFDRVNVDGTRTLLEEAVRSGVTRFLFVSSAHVGGTSSARPMTEEDPPRPSDPYARSKERAEQVVKEIGRRAGIWTGILRPPMVYGAGNRGNLPRLASLIERGVPLPFGGVSNSRSVVFVGNLVRAIKLLLDRQPGTADVFYVADDNPLSTADLAREIGLALGTPARIVNIPPLLLTSAARAGDAIASISRFPFTSRELNKLTGTLLVDDSKLRKATGYKPPVSTPEGIRQSFPHVAAAAGTRAPGVWAQ
jgi:nucleoside-diphosphate-sugar epimerase